jgi:hypothetical protein
LVNAPLHGDVVLPGIAKTILPQGSRAAVEGEDRIGSSRQFICETERHRVGRAANTSVDTAQKTVHAVAFIHDLTNRLRALDYAVGDLLIAFLLRIPPN